MNNAWDAEWFLEIKRIRYPLLLHNLQIDGSVIRTQFDNFNDGKIDAPKFVYSNRSLEKCEAALKELSQLRIQILQQDTEKSIQALYLEKIDEVMLELRIVISSCNERWGEFAEFNERRYGRFDPAVVDDIRRRLSEKNYRVFGKVKYGSEELSNFDSDNTQKEFARSRFVISPLTIEIDTDRFYKANEAITVFNRELSKLDENWCAVLSDTANSIIVNSRLRKVLVPFGISVSGGRLRDLVAHEVGVHVRRRINGRESKVQLLGIGLPGYEGAEEGLAVYSEQILNGRKYYGGQDKYLALMIAKGELDGVARDFADTYRKLSEYFMERSRRLNKPITPEKSKWKAWKTTYRIFRGGNPTMPGNCFLRDKIYREGYFKIRQCIQNNPEYFANVYAGKFDPGNKLHRDIVAKTLQ